MSKVLYWVVWVLRILLAVAFIFAGYGKLSGNPQMVAAFDKIGFGRWFLYFTGATEETGALLLLIPATGVFGALLLGVTMICAVTAHLLVLGGSPAAAIILGVLCWFVAYRLRGQLPWLKS